MNRRVHGLSTSINTDRGTTSSPKMKSPGKRFIENDSGVCTHIGALETASASATPAPPSAAVVRLARCRMNQHPVATATAPGAEPHHDAEEQLSEPHRGNIAMFAMTAAPYPATTASGQIRMLAKRFGGESIVLK